MIYKDSKESLLKEDFIKKCPIDYKAIKNLIKRAYIDLKTAKRNLDDDEECSYNYAYNAMLHSGLALMFSQGFRPEIKNKHLTIVKFASSVLGNKFKRVINNYDFMRRKRHRFIYEPDIPCSRKEAEDALRTAKEFVDIISKSIKEKDPQIELDLK
ncbi:MAG: HEPN domain-containing protein [Candidatus Cloacimonetes bacterium]|nr:HEPN domain-containing protein [Candidatus Cloacimonadota bacterium]